MRVGLYFGSFNPIHTGHLIIANHILNETDIQKLWFIVSPQNPFKPSATLLNEYDRLHYVQKAVEDDSRLQASNIEFTLPKPSYTSHSLSYLADKYSTHQFSIIMGSDSFQNLPKWKNAEMIMATYPILVYRRPGFEANTNVNGLVTVLDAPLLEISATHIRRCIQQGKSIKYLVPKIIEEEIAANAFYKKIHKK
jgi:nicotinate-nucleotide adenylyltransferase